MNRSFLLGFKFLIFSMLITTMGVAQEKRLSPAAKAAGTVGTAHIKINYSSPYVKGRKIWGELVPYGEVWRAGANEATTFETDKALMIEGKSLPAGRYALFAIPGEKTWTIIFNKNPDQWGAFKYDDKLDALRVIVTPRKAAKAESLVYKFTKDGFVLKWELLEVPVKVKS